LGIKQNIEDFKKVKRTLKLILEDSYNLNCSDLMIVEELAEVMESLHKHIKK